jgi:hypothetical protein
MYNLPIQGGYLGNAGGLNQLIAGGPDLPFGGGGGYRTIQNQYRPGQRSNDPVRVLPSTEPGREAAIGNMAAMLQGGPLPISTPQTAGFDRKYVY